MVDKVERVAREVMASMVEAVVQMVEQAAKVAMVVARVAAGETAEALHNAHRACLYVPRGTHVGPRKDRKIPPYNKMQCLRHKCVDCTCVFLSGKSRFHHGNRNSCLRRHGTACHQSR